MMHEWLSHGSGGSDGSLARVDGLAREPLTKDVVRPVVMEWLSNETKRWGIFAHIPVIQGFCDALEAKNRLIQNDDWTGAMSLLFLQRDHIFSNMRKEFNRLPLHYTASPKYQKKLENDSGPKSVRFYGALWNLLNLVMDQKEVQVVLSALESSGIASARTPLETELEYYQFHYQAIAKYLIIPQDSQDQLALVKELGPQIYLNWHLEE